MSILNFIAQPIASRKKTAPLAVQPGATPLSVSGASPVTQGSTPSVGAQPSLPVLDFVSKPAVSIGGIEVSNQVLNEQNKREEIKAKPVSQQFTDLPQSEIRSAAPESPVLSFIKKVTPQAVQDFGKAVKEGVFGTGQGVDITGKMVEDTGALGMFRPFGFGKTETEKVYQRVDALKPLVEQGVVTEERADEIAKNSIKDRITGLKTGRGVQKDLSLTPQEKQALRPVFIEETLDQIFGALDFVSLGTTKAISRTAAEKIAKSTATEEILGVLLRENPTIKKEGAEVIAKALVYVDNVDDVQKVLNRLEFAAKGVAQGADTASPVKGLLAGKVKSAVVPYAGETDLTLKTLEKLKGRSTVSRQFISDLTNAPDLKQSERDAIRTALEDEADQVNVPDFAEKVKENLLPLERMSLSEAEDEMTGRSLTRFENVNLSDDLRGPVANYDEHIYRSPVKTSAGQVHFGDADPGDYFAHSRVEDMADGKAIITAPGEYQTTGGGTRRVIEIQSDLFQKGRLESEMASPLDADDMAYAYPNPKDQKLAQIDIDRRNAEIAKLEPYRNTWHERVIREEVKQAAKDGKTKLQFPTGETAMKIEGLGESPMAWKDVTEEATKKWADLPELSPDTLKVGKTIEQINQPGQWIITDVLGDGKFKAIPKDILDNTYPDQTGPAQVKSLKLSGQGDHSSIETFDISGKVDQNNPIYKFYEKEVGRYLKNKYSATLITDAQGVKWWEVNVKPEAAQKPVEAFQKTKPGLTKLRIATGKQVTMDEALDLIFEQIDPRDVRVIFKDELIQGNALGAFYKDPQYDPVRGVLKPLIALYQTGGMVSAQTALHEAGHYLFNNFLTDAERAEAIAYAEKKMTFFQRYTYDGYKKEQIAEEWLVDEYAKNILQEKGWRSDNFLRRFFGRLDQILDYIIKTVEKVTGRMKDLFRTPGASKRGAIKNPFAGGADDLPINRKLEQAIDEFNKLPVDADDARIARIEKNIEKQLPVNVAEFDALPADLQDEVYDLLPNRLQVELTGFDLSDLETKDPMTRVAHAALSLPSRKKIRLDGVGPGERKTLRENIGKKLYNRLFTTNPEATSASIEEFFAETVPGMSREYENKTGGIVDAFLDRLPSAIQERQIMKEEQLADRAKELRIREVEASRLKDPKAREEFTKTRSKEVQEVLAKKRFTYGQRWQFEERAQKTGETIGRRETRAIELKKRQELRAKKEAEIKQIIGQTRDRKKQIRAVADALMLTDAELNSIIKNKNIATMDTRTFDGLLNEVYGRGQQIAERAEARMMVKATIFEKELRNTENLQKAMGLPPVSEMTTAQLREFDKALQPFEQGDEFLSKRKLEMIDRTSLEGAKTVREARAALAKKLGVPVEQLSKINVGEFDRFKWDTSLAETNPFYKLMVEGFNGSILEGDAAYLEIEEKVDALMREARKGGSLVDKAIPTDEKIFNYLESTDKEELALKMTPAELEAAEYMRTEFADALAYQYEMNMLGKSSYEDNYITHIRRNFFEALKDGDLKGAFRELLDRYKQDEAVLNILDQKTGQVLPLEKFFKFAMRREGGIVPTKNVAKAFTTYMRTFERKKALDKIIPEIMAYVDVLTPQEFTPKGLYKDDRLATFVKEYLNNKKGRRATLFVKPGGKGDFIVRSVKGLTTLLDLAINIPLQIGSMGGAQTALYTVMGAKRQATGIKRLLTKEGQAFVKQFANYTGKTTWAEFVETSKGLPEKAYGLMFALFRDATVRANKIHLLGSLTDAEWKAGKISTERLAELRTEAGRFLPIEGAESILGSTAEGGLGTQYKKWAIPPLRTTIKNLGQISKMLAQKENPFKSREFWELLRIAQVGALVSLVAYAVGNDSEKKESERTFTDKLINKTLRDSFSMISAIDPQTYTSVPRTLTFVTDLMGALSQLVRLEEYQTDGETFEKGDLKGVEKLRRTFTPAIIKSQTQQTKVPAKSSTLPLSPISGLLKNKATPTLRVQAAQSGVSGLLKNKKLKQ